MTLINKLERALAFAKELNLNDLQTKQLFDLVLENASVKINWVPNQTYPAPAWPDGTIITNS